MSAMREALAAAGFHAPSPSAPPRARRPSRGAETPGTPGAPPVRVPHNVRKSVVSYLVRGWTPAGAEHDAVGFVAGLACRATFAPGISNAAWSAEAVRHVRRVMLAQNPQSDAHRARLCRELVASHVSPAAATGGSR